jgi:hypothetical protein
MIEIVPVAHGKTVPMQRTGIPVAVLAMALLMVFAGVLIPKLKK